MLSPGSPYRSRQDGGIRRCTKNHLRGRAPCGTFLEKFVSELGCFTRSSRTNAGESGLEVCTETNNLDFVTLVDDTAFNL